MSAMCKCGHSHENHSVRGGFPFCEGTTMAACDCKLYEPKPTAKHTPGPWRTERNPSNTKQWIVIASTHETVVHQVAGGKEHAEANARLIAAAPELLEALKEVLPYMEAAEKAGLVGDEGCHWPVELVRAAIVEAEGGRHA